MEKERVGAQKTKQSAVEYKWLYIVHTLIIHPTIATFSCIIIPKVFVFTIMRQSNGRIKWHPCFYRPIEYLRAKKAKLGDKYPP